MLELNTVVVIDQDYSNSINIFCKLIQLLVAGFVATLHHEVVNNTYLHCRAQVRNWVRSIYLTLVGNVLASVGLRVNVWRNQRSITMKNKN